MSDTDPRSGGFEPMTCERAWAELSAGLDGEQSAPLAALDEHLATCVDCRNRKDAAHRLTRRVRLTSAQAIPDRAPQIVGAVLADRVARRRGALGRRLVRGGLVAAAFAQSVVVVPPLVLGRAGGGIPLHASRELGAFNLALAVGFVVASLRPAYARGMLPLVGVATGALVLLVAVDSAFGETTPHAELPHVIALVGCLLLCRLACTDKTDSGGPTRGVVAGEASAERVVGTLPSTAPRAGSPVWRRLVMRRLPWRPTAMCVRTAGLIRNASRLRSLSREGPPWRSGAYDECVTIAGNRMASLSDYH